MSPDAATRNSDGPRHAPLLRYLNCPDCRLSVRSQALSLKPLNCPRCLARTRTRVELLSSLIPAEGLYGDGTRGFNGSSPRRRFDPARPDDDDSNVAGGR